MLSMLIVCAWLTFLLEIIHRQRIFIATSDKSQEVFSWGDPDDCLMEETLEEWFS